MNKISNTGALDAQMSLQPAERPRHRRSIEDPLFITRL
jgi:hypothetical protein